ncbi:TetR/AcrR family transcriptional regulator [Kribbella solani]|uniref:AcrR family transcriptional regulator n=1 Tax=Kribbella solani TaxID=236067 RepID=A0A841DM63_9ACTN|nr:TetR/AcrR family transcriptional regulator [Kribbella solani]MBB5977750.1 AcrR family transcriptional regulator [Kribbella solani]MDX2969516.1 helix-turn-helix domain containing protein [Kribbella solani]MDX3006118.1 helix-turn-helix domain containing protein [Kribbella solani]
MTSSRGPYAKGVAKRAELLRAVLAVIARHGYRKTSTRELAAAAGLSEAGMLHYFGSKEKLFEAVLRARDEADLERFDVDDSIEGLAVVIRHNRTVPGLVQLYSTFSAEAGDPEHHAHDFFVDRYAHLRAALADAVRARQAAGTFTPTADPDAIATLLIAVSDGLQIQSQYNLTTNPGDLFDHLLTLLTTPPRNS